MFAKAVRTFTGKGGEAIKQFTALLGIHIIFYAPALSRHFFWWDDIDFLVPAHSGLKSIADIHMGHFLPVFRLWMIGQWRLFGLHSPPYQVVSMLLLAVTSFLFLRLLLQSGVSGIAAMMAAVAFAGSPINCENAVWLTMQSQELMAVLFLAALLLLPDCPLAAAIALLLSFGSFGAGLLLIVPFCLYCLLRYDKVLFKPLALGFGATAVFAGARIFSHVPATHLSHRILDFQSWAVALVLGCRHLAEFNTVNWGVPAAAIAAGVLLAKPRRISWRRVLFLIVPLSLAIVFMLAAYWFRGYIVRRHLMMPFLAVLWLATVVICGGRVGRIREMCAAGVLVVFAFYPFWRHAQQETQAYWNTYGESASSYTQDLRRLLARDKPIFDTHLLRAVNPDFKISEYAPLTGRTALLITDASPAATVSSSAEYPEKYTADYAGLAAWLAINPDAETRDFYARYYLMGALPPPPDNLLRNGRFENDLSAWTLNRVLSAGDPDSNREHYAAIVRFESGGCLSQTVAGIPPGTYDAAVVVRSPTRMVWGFIPNGAAIPRSAQYPGSGNYEFLQVQTAVPSGVHSISVRLCSPSAGTADIARAMLFRPAKYHGTSPGCAIDSINGSLANPLDVHRDTVGGITVEGWAVDLSARELPDRVVLSLDGRMDFPVLLGTARPDVASALHNERYENSGFSGFLLPSLIPDGEHVLSLKIVSHDGSGYWACAPGAPRIIRIVE